MRAVPVPVFRELAPEECSALLSRNHIGRIAFSFKDRVDIEPIHYVHHGEWLYVRTAPGTKVMMVAHNRWVAFEVDEVEGPFDWRSVVVHGSVYLLDPDGSKQEKTAYADAIDLLRTVAPATFTAEDPAPFRSLLLRIHIDEMTGRAASTGQ